MISPDSLMTNIQSESGTSGNQDNHIHTPLKLRIQIRESILETCHVPVPSGSKRLTKARLMAP